MAERPTNFFKRLIVDFAGFSLLVLSVLTGWIPGPGGIPLFIAGLSLLSINHPWAKRWLAWAKSGGLSLSGRIFRNHPVVKVVLDILGIALLALAIFILNRYTRNLFRSLAISAAIGGLSLLLGNRKRIHWLSNWAYQLKGHGRIRRKQPKHYSLSQGNKLPILLLPGVATKWHFMKHLADKLSLSGHRVLVMPSLKRNLLSIPEAASLVADFIKEHKLKQVVIIGHSKGGLIAKYALYHCNNDNSIVHIIAIATPFHGSRLARLIPHSAFRELLPDSQTIAKLLSKSNLNHQITSIYPEFDNYINHPKGSLLIGASNIIIQSKGHDKIVFDKRVESKIIEILNKLETI